MECWPEALGLWSRFTRLRDPILCLTDDAAASQGLTDSFAMIRLVDQRIVVNLASVSASGVEDYGLEILAHEIGHHIYAPADLADQARLLGRIRRGLPTREGFAGMVANLYTDLLINDRLQRDNRLRIGEVFGRLYSQDSADIWKLYMRIYEILWGLKRGSLTGPQVNDEIDGDAYLGARLVRVYARDWLNGAGGFAVLCLPYLLKIEEPGLRKGAGGWLDTENAGRSADPPAGLIEAELGELNQPPHPASDPRITGVELDAPPSGDIPAESAAMEHKSQAHQPFEYGEILTALGLQLSNHDVAVRYYRERALPYLVRYPERLVAQAGDPMPEGVETWDVGSPLDELDWQESILTSPQVIPGFTTRQRTWGVSEGGQPVHQPPDLDLYIDSSGSMPNPQVLISYLALAGTIITLSALRAGARVRATLWSGAHQFQATDGFVRDENALLRVITGYIGGGTAFPIHSLRDTFTGRKPNDRPVHILVISDEGVTTMFDKDEQGNSGWDIARLALEKGHSGGSLALNLYAQVETIPELVRAAAEGWDVYRLQSWEELLDFGRAFSKKRYER